MSRFAAEYEAGLDTPKFDIAVGGKPPQVTSLYWD
jgi:hypothetical protein